MLRGPHTSLQYMSTFIFMLYAVHTYRAGQHIHILIPNPLGLEECSSEPCRGVAVHSVAHLTVSHTTLPHAHTWSLQMRTPDCWQCHGPSPPATTSPTPCPASIPGLHKCGPQPGGSGAVHHLQPSILGERLFVHEGLGGRRRRARAYSGSASSSMKAWGVGGGGRGHTRGVPLRP